MEAEQLVVSFILIRPSVKAHRLMPLGLSHRCVLRILHLFFCECLQPFSKREKKRCFFSCEKLLPFILLLLFFLNWCNFTIKFKNGNSVNKVILFYVQAV